MAPHRAIEIHDSGRADQVVAVIARNYLYTAEFRPSARGQEQLFFFHARDSARVCGRILILYVPNCNL